MTIIYMAIIYMGIGIMARSMDHSYTCSPSFGTRPPPSCSSLFLVLSHGLFSLLIFFKYSSLIFNNIFFQNINIVFISSSGDAIKRFINAEHQSSWADTNCVPFPLSLSQVGFYFYKIMSNYQLIVI